MKVPKLQFKGKTFCAKKTIKRKSKLLRRIECTEIVHAETPKVLIY